MSLLKRLGLVETTEIPKKEEKKPVAVAPSFTPSTTPSFSDVGDYGNLLEKVLEDRDLPGPDFLELYKALKNMENLSIPEEQKYIAVFAGLQATGLTKDKVVTSSQTYIEALNTERQNFVVSLQSARKRDVEDKKAEAQKLEQENKELQQKIQENITKMSQMNMEAAQADNSLSMKEKQFESAVGTALNKIQEIVSKTQLNIP